MAGALDKAKGYGEAGLSIGSALLGSVPAGLGGLYELLKTRDPKKAAEAVESMQESMTYIPRTEEGVKSLQGAAGALETLGAPAAYVGEKTLGATGSPLAATAAEVVLDPLNLLGSAVVAKGTKSAVKGAKAAGRALAPKAAEMTESYMRGVGMMPSITEGVSYGTKQEGPFYRVAPADPELARLAHRGVRETPGQGPEAAPGGTRGELSQPVSDEAVKQTLADPNNFVKRVADRYAQELTGRPYELPKIPESSLVKQSPIGRVFQLGATDEPAYKAAVFDRYGQQFPELIEQTGAQNYDQLLEAAYRQLVKETKQQFESLPVNMSFHRAGEGNYLSSNEMLKDVYGNRHLYVFQGGEPHPFMNDVDPKTGLNSTEMFRAVHDFYGHAIHGNQFGPKGEEIAYAAHSQMYSPLARLAMATETRGQNSVVNYTPLNAALKAKIAKLDEIEYEAKRRKDMATVRDVQAAKKDAWGAFQFAPQKGLLLPPEFLEVQFAGGMPDYIQPLIRPQAGTTTSSELVHFSKAPGLTQTDPRRYGQGIKGEEAERLSYVPGAVKERTYFYAGEPGAVTPEPGLGPYKYRAQSGQLYDVGADPLELRTLAAESSRTPFTAKYNPGMQSPEQAITDVERMIKEYGYEGMVNPKLTKPTAIMYGPTAVQPFAEGGPVSLASITDKIADQLMLTGMDRDQAILQASRMADAKMQEQKMSVGGLLAKTSSKAAAKGAAKVAEKAAEKAEEVKPLEEAIRRMNEKLAKEAADNKTKPIASPAVVASTTNKMADQIAKKNPKLSEADVAKKAERGALAKLKWEREEKPALESRYGLLNRSTFDDPRAERLRNIPEAVERRIKKAEEFLAQPTESWKPPRGALQAFDRSLIKDALEGFPGIEQTRFPRYEPARADTGYIDEIYGDPRNRALIEKQIKRGLPLGGETFYASLYPVKVAAMERGMSPEKFEQFVYQTAPASARNSIMNEMAVGQFLRDMNARGLPLDEKTVTEEMAKFKQQYGTGLPLMPVHREGVRQVIEGGQNMRDMLKADIPTNYKIPTYGTQKAGDFGKSMVLDVHESAGQTQGSRYHPYFTEQGGFGPTEYGLAESKMLDIANQMGIPGGMAQAGRWFGGGELTGLKSPRGDALDLLERQVAYTMQGQGIKPTPKRVRDYVLDMIESGRGVLMPYFKSEGMPDYRVEKKKGGAVKKPKAGALAQATR